MRKLDLVVSPDESKDGARPQEALDLSNAIDETLGFIASAMFSTIQTLLKVIQRYTLEDEELDDWLSNKVSVGRRNATASVL